MKVTPRTAGLLILLYMGLIGVWTWRLMPPPPNQGAEAAWQSMQAKAASYLAKAPKDTAMPALMRLAKMPQDQLQALADWVDQPALNQIRQLTVQKGTIIILGPEWGEALLQTWLVHAPPVNLLEAHLMVAAAGDRLPEQARQTALETLARRALAQGDAADAVTILGRATELPGATWGTLQQLTAAARAARNTAPALRALTLWIQRHADDTDEAILEQARDLEFTLMMQAGDVAEALSYQLSQLIGSVPFSERTLDRAWLAARRAHQGSRLLPLLEQHLKSFPEHDLPNEKLTQQTDIHPDYLRWLTCHAAICDDEQPAPIAFASHLRLAAARVPAALPRLCALATSPAQKTQAAQALSTALDRAELQLTALQLAQTDPIARKVLSDRLRTAPHQRDLHYAATLATAAAQTTGSTALLCQDFLRRFTGDVPAQRRLIQAHLDEQQPALALRAYTALPAKALTNEDRQQQAILKQL